MKNLNRNLNVLICICLTVLSLHCTTKISLKEFDQKQWVTDSISCNGYRAKHYQKILDSKQYLQGKSKKEIQHFFGKPNIQKNDLYYFIESGVQCLDYIDKDGYDTIETASVILEFDLDNRVQNIRKIVP
jgi:hypothetical protein